AECREAAGFPPSAARTPGGADEPCVQPREVHRFADASPDLIYSADVLLDAFPDAQLLQVIRDGRDVVADMLADERCMAWFKPSLSNLDEVFPNPFLGVEDVTDRARWSRAAPAVKCALRWRGSVRLSARLRAQTPEEQLLTVRFEDLVSKPREVAEAVSRYLDAPISTGALDSLVRRGASFPDDRRVGIWRERLTPRQLTQVERVAGVELGRLGYAPSGAG
ncbi:MAG: sulfotransferase, partial [Actinomadura rubrobrunea]|nr:sulfotransferase [Actinomadura rubrobrunea]